MCKYVWRSIIWAKDEFNDWSIERRIYSFNICILRKYCNIVENWFSKKETNPWDTEMKKNPEIMFKMKLSGNYTNIRITIIYIR